STLLRSVLVEVLAQMLDLQLGQLAGRKTRAGIFVATLTAHEHPGPLVVVTSDGKFLVKPFELARDDAVHWRPPSKVVMICGCGGMTIRCSANSCHGVPPMALWLCHPMILTVDGTIPQSRKALSASVKLSVKR